MNRRKRLSRKTPLNPGEIPLKRTPLRRVRSTRLKRLEARLHESRLIVKQRSGGVCEVGIHGVCEYRSSHVHHRKRRREGDHSPENLLDLCNACHRYIHNPPRSAYVDGVSPSYLNGWLVKTTEDPGEVPWTNRWGTQSF